MTATTALYPTIERLADLSRTTVGYQKPDLEREAVECYRECAALRAERDALLKVVAAADELNNALIAEQYPRISYLRSEYTAARAALEEPTK